MNEWTVGTYNDGPEHAPWRYIVFYGLDSRTGEPAAKTGARGFTTEEDAQADAQAAIEFYTHPDYGLGRRQHNNLGVFS